MAQFPGVTNDWNITAAQVQCRDQPVLGISGLWMQSWHLNNFAVALPWNWALG